MAKISSEQRLRNANLSLSDENFGPDLRLPSRASRVDNSDGSKVGPNMGKVNKPKAKVKPAKVTKKEVTIETPTGNIGARNSFDAGEVNPFAGSIKPAFEPLINYPSRTADVIPEDIAAASIPAAESRFSTSNPMGMKKGGKVKCMSSGGSSKASSRGDGCAQRGKTRGRMV